MNRITADQVATFAGVSRSAVSRSFSRTASVAPETRRKVLQAAAALGYRPNGLASTLASGKSNIVAVVTNSAPDTRRSHILHLLNTTLQEIGLVPYFIAIDQSYEGAATLAKLIQMPLMTAIVTADAVTCRDIRPYCGENPPIMLNGKTEPGDVADQVLVDDAGGIRQMIRHLDAIGKQTLWLITARRSSNAFLTRSVAMLEALAGTNLRLVDREEGDFTYESGKSALGSLNDRGDLPDAVFCANDMMAMGAMDEIRFTLGRSVPNDIAVIGFDDIPQAGWPTYCLPTIRQDPKHLVAAIEEIIRKRLGEGGTADPIQRSVKTSFLPRNLERG